MDFYQIGFQLFSWASVRSLHHPSFSAPEGFEVLKFCLGVAIQFFHEGGVHLRDFFFGAVYPRHKIISELCFTFERELTIPVFQGNDFSQPYVVISPSGNFIPIPVWSFRQRGGFLVFIFYAKRCSLLQKCNVQGARHRFLGFRGSDLEVIAPDHPVLHGLRLPTMLYS